MIISISIILLIISFSAYSSMWTIQFHFYQSIFSLFKNQNFWDPLKSSNNKWKNGIKANGEVFLFSSTALVFLTDGFHLMQFIFENCLYLSFSIYGNVHYKWYFAFIAIRIIYAVIWNPLFDYILLKSKN